MLLIPHASKACHVTLNVRTKPLPALQKFVPVGEVTKFTVGTVPHWSETAGVPNSEVLTEQPF